MLPPITTEQHARAILAAGLAKAELEFVTSLTAPLYWVIREGDDLKVKNGSAFFLDVGEGLFAVTAQHVIQAWKNDCKASNVVALQLGTDLSIDFEGRNAIIAADEDIDIATFRVSRPEVAAIRKTVLTGIQARWPPRAPEQGKGIYFCGFPCVQTLRLSRGETSFGASPAGGVASSVSEKDVSSLIDRSALIPVLGRGTPPENFDFSGISGGPMLGVIEQRGLRSWALAGVIYEGPNQTLDPTQSIEGLEIIKARRAHFILPDGTLDTGRWVKPNR